MSGIGAVCKEGARDREVPPNRNPTPGREESGDARLACFLIPRPDLALTGRLKTPGHGQGQEKPVGPFLADG